jgi:hypothetical protein
VIAALPVLVAIGACDSIGADDSPRVSVSFAVPHTTSGSNASFVAAADPITVNGHVLDLQTADVTFSRIKLDRKNSSSSTVADGDSDSEDDSDEEEEIRFGTTTVTLPLQGGIITPINVPIPAGDYESIELKISSLRLRGTFDGQAFDVVLPLNVELEQRFSPLFHVDSDADQLNITVLIDSSLWLRNSDGTLIDPRVLLTNESLRAQVLNRIRASFKAFEDEDKDADDEDSDSDSDSD